MLLGVTAGGRRDQHSPNEAMFGPGQHAHRSSHTHDTLGPGTLQSSPALLSQPNLCTNFSQGSATLSLAEVSFFHGFFCIYNSSFFGHFVYTPIYLSIYLSKVVYVHTYSMYIHTSPSEAVYTNWFSIGNVGTNNFSVYIQNVWTTNFQMYRQDKVIFCD